MTRLATLALALALALILLVTGFVAGRVTATPRRAQDIPVVESSTASRTPGLTEAPLDPAVAQRCRAPECPEVTGAAPVRGANGGASFTARTTWYCLPGVSRCTKGYPASCLCAAASADLHLRGKLITVTYGGRSVTVRVVDCLCSRSGLDLYAAAFARLAPLSRGVLTATFRVVG